MNETDNERGYIYALENKSFSGYIKIGQTKNLEHRLFQFNSTGIPDGKPTLLLFAVYIKNYKKAERILHKTLSDKRKALQKNISKQHIIKLKVPFRF